jgi:MFS transporter, YNFM family, putative membrane transport protein
LEHFEIMVNEDGTSREIRQRHMIMALAGFCAFLGLNMTQPLLPMLRALFHVSAGEASLTVGAAIMAVAIAAPVAGMIADAVGRKKVIVLSLLGLSAFTALGAAAPNLHLLILFRFFQGLFVPGVVATAMAYIAEESPAGSMSSIMATYVTGTVIGGFSGRFICGLIASHWGWRLPFIILGGLTFAGMFAVRHYLPPAKHFVRESDPMESLRNLRMHLRNPQLLAIYAVAFQVLFALVGTFTYISFYLAAPPFHLGSAALGSLFFVYLIGAVITPLSGKLIDGVGNSKAVALALLCSACGVLMTLSENLWLVILGLAVCCSGVFVCQAAASGQIGKVAQTARSSAAGLYVSIYYAGGGVSSVLLGFFWEWGGWPACVAVVVALEIFTAALAFFLWKDRQSPSTA